MVPLMDTDLGHQQQQEEQQQMEAKNHFTELAAIDVGKYVEKKGTLKYLSWAWAVDQLLRRDPDAKWEYGEPRMFGETMQVVCTVTAFGKPRTMHLPVMNHRNQAIAAPDAFAVNTAMQRCLVKAIALHGLGLYIYAGEDVPRAPDEPEANGVEGEPATNGLDPSAEADLIASLDEATSIDDLRQRLEKALAIAQQGGDVEAHKRIKAKGIELAAKFPREAA
jgi:hypothetical protein